MISRSLRGYYRVATRQGKIREIIFFQGQGIVREFCQTVREIWNDTLMSGNYENTRFKLNYLLICLRPHECFGAVLNQVVSTSVFDVLLSPGLCVVVIMAFKFLRIVLLNCHYRPRTKMSISGKFEISSGKCQGKLIPSERGNPVLMSCFNGLRFYRLVSEDKKYFFAFCLYQRPRHT